MQDGALVVIPARLGARRLPGKPLAEIAGRPMVVHVVDRVRRARRVSRVVVATDAPRIRDVVLAYGGEAVLTSARHRSGTDRVAEAVRKLAPAASVVVNVQGDEPLIDPATVDALVEALDERGAEVATAAAPLDGDPSQPDRVKVVTAGALMPGAVRRAIYFSRAPVPHGGPWWVHLGVYAFRRPALEAFAGWPVSPLERTERLEQLRLLERGVVVRVLGVARAEPSVDTEKDLARVRARMAECGVDTRVIE